MRRGAARAARRGGARLALVVACALAATACAAPADDERAAVGVQVSPQPSPLPPVERPPAPVVPDGPLAPALDADLLRVVRGLGRFVDVRDVAAVGGSGDPRVLWELSDLLRLLAGRADGDAIVAAASELAGTDVTAGATGSQWQALTDLLISWDLPAAPGYVERKATILTRVEPAWAPFLADPDADVDWRLVSWGGVLVDDRPLGATEPCPRGCIPALDDPAVTDTAGGAWFPDDATVLGVVVDGEARAYPKNIMEVHEMVNDTLGGRRLGIPYCTLCGSAQAYLLDEVDPGLVAASAREDAAPDDQLVLRTSGLLVRSNKVMYDLTTGSVLDTFTGQAVTGPLRDAGVDLAQVSVVTTSWAAWKQAHPTTTIVAEDGGIGRSYPEDPLRGRDDGGPIFPVGDVDPRLAAHARVLGVELPDGGHLALDAVAARNALLAGEQVLVDGVEVVLDGGGLRARRAGVELAVHEAFWFAWSQFHPDTALWPATGA